MNIEEEMKDKDWDSFNHTVLSAYGIDAYYQNICNSLISMRKSRRTAKETFDVKDITIADVKKYNTSSADNISMAAEPNNKANA